MGKGTSYKNYMNYYSATSEAFALDSWEQTAEIPAVRTVRRPRPARRPKVVYKRAVSNEKFFSSRMVLSLLLVFTGLVLCTMSFAALRRSQLEMSAMRTELQQLQEEEAVLRAKIAEEYDVTQIEKVATMRLNMSKPKAYQIVYINAPKQDYVVQYGAAAKEEPSGFMERVSALVSALASGLYNR